MDSQLIQQLAYIAQDRGYKQSWIYATYKAKYGVFPGHCSEYMKQPIPPSQETLQLVRDLQFPSS